MSKKLKANSEAPHQYGDLYLDSWLTSCNSGITKPELPELPTVVVLVMLVMLDSLSHGPTIKRMLSGTCLHQLG